MPYVAPALSPGGRLTRGSEWSALYPACCACVRDGAVRFACSRAAANHGLTEPLMPNARPDQLITGRLS
jgi:hypothetical protein